jgi:hypothetical protein
MTMSAKWTAVSFFAVTALAAGSFAFAGCTVTSGNPDNVDGGNGNNPPTDSGTTTTDGGTDSAVVASTCEGNKQTSGDFVNATCQAKLNTECCAELKGCFNLVVDADAGGATDDCNTFAKCVDLAQKQTSQADKEAAQAECDLGAPQAVKDAYDAIVACATNKANAECQ